MRNFVESHHYFEVFGTGSVSVEILHTFLDWAEYHAAHVGEIVEEDLFIKALDVKSLD
jgi:hypothetical protein